MFVAFLVFGVILLAIGKAARRQHARELATPVTQVSNAKLGRVSLYGRALGEPAHAAPLTSKLSAYWQAELWDTRWARNRLPAAKEMSPALVLWLQDDSGRIPVLLHGVEWIIAGEDEFLAGRPLPPAAHTFIERNGYRWDSGHVRVQERRIEQGESIHVLGVIAPVAAVTGVLDGLKSSPLYQAVEAMSARRPGGRADLDPASYLRDRFRPEDRIVWCEREALVISSRPAHVATRRMQWTARLCTAAGCVLLVAAIAALLLPA